MFTFTAAGKVLAFAKEMGINQPGDGTAGAGNNQGDDVKLDKTRVKLFCLYYLNILITVLYTINQNLSLIDAAADNVDMMACPPNGKPFKELTLLIEYNFSPLVTQLGEFVSVVEKCGPLFKLYTGNPQRSFKEILKASQDARSQASTIIEKFRSAQTKYSRHIAKCSLIVRAENVADTGGKVLAAALCAGTPVVTTNPAVAKQLLLDINSYVAAIRKGVDKLYESVTLPSHAAAAGNAPKQTA